jgi:hypothetical protein
VTTPGPQSPPTGPLLAIIRHSRNRTGNGSISADTEFRGSLPVATAMETVAMVTEIVGHQQTDRENKKHLLFIIQARFINAFQL